MKMVKVDEKDDINEEDGRNNLKLLYVFCFDEDGKEKKVPKYIYLRL